jgi:hypothetical protein
MAAKCVVFSEEGLAIADISPELYDALKKRVYQDWWVWVAQAANVVWAVWALITVPATPNGLFHQAKEQKRLSHKAIEKS